MCSNRWKILYLVRNTRCYENRFKTFKNIFVPEKKYSTPNFAFLPRAKFWIFNISRLTFSNFSAQSTERYFLIVFKAFVTFSYIVSLKNQIFVNFSMVVPENAVHNKTLSDELKTPKIFRNFFFRNKYLL